MCSTKSYAPTGDSLSIKDVKVYAEETDLYDNGAWVLHVSWKDENNDSKNASYDVEVLLSEQMKPIHIQNVHLNPDKTGLYLWKWTSPIPLQCTSLSVRLRRRDQHHISKWTTLYVHEGQDQITRGSFVYPQDHVFMVGSRVRFCCILESSNASLSNSSQFVLRISNRTYITAPINFHEPSDSTSDVHCDIKGSPSAGSSVFVGYPPDDQNLTCVTRDLSSTECHWSLGRKTYLHGPRKTNYSLNGRECEFNQCDQQILTKQVTKWTLIAKNPLGLKTLTDTADPMRRSKFIVESTEKIRNVAHARNVTLLWSWDITKYITTPLLCQVMLSGNIYNETFCDVGLASVMLTHLQPFNNYTAKVRCGSSEYFYKWGDWSEITAFSTKEDYPEAVDVWIRYSEHSTHILWKPLTVKQSHGIITGYELTLENNTDEKSLLIDIGANEQLCYDITSRNEKKITVSGKNSAGLSPPSTMVISRYLGNGINVSRVYGSKGGFDFFWKKSPFSTCGYVVEWFPSNSKTNCDVKWEKIPGCVEDTCEKWNRSGDFEAGVRYVFSVYACTKDAPVLLQRNEGYAVEQRPAGTVQNLRGKQIARNLQLSWDEVPLAQQQGFILGYKVEVIHSASITNTTVTKEHKVNLTLGSGSYTFKVFAFTSGGEGDAASFTMDIENDLDQMIAATVIWCTAATLVFVIIAALCYRKRKWLKKRLYPDVPEPKLTGTWTTKSIYSTRGTGGFLKCELQEVYGSEHYPTSENLQDIDLHGCQATLLSSNSNTNTSPVCDPHHIPLNTSAKLFENPSYNLAVAEPISIPERSGLLEMQDCYLPVQEAQNINGDCFHPACDFLQPVKYILEESYLPPPNHNKALKESRVYRSQY
ncbi:hypothetical protein DNTS_034130 [Danionella cerebrum]|uniref:Fibronectin type-III domain-containing protein n=1 Tax=Danionella cerebrum TaxID=2873325 RepID=A0A553R6T6_9TELE|nr:hypothetical protein DNTS_034130 [Danionella translucida]TRY97900.1 hypothetical protein DNTS_034130 [Danionella translucida]